MNKLSTLLFIFLSTMILLSSACVVPQKVIRVQPDDQENVFWYQGQAIAEKKQADIVVRSAFSHANREYLIFDIEVFNERSEAILVTPEIMTLAGDTGPARRALDPEKILLSMEMEQSRQKANATNAAIVGGVVLVGAAIAVAVSDDDNDSDSDSNDSDWESDDYTTGAAITDAVIPAVSLWLDFHQDPVLSVPPSELPNTDDIYFWDETTLRRTTLRPGEHIRGLVAFPRIDDTETLNLKVPIETEDFLFMFTQRVFQP